MESPEDLSALSENHVFNQYLDAYAYEYHAADDLSL